MDRIRYESVLKDARVRRALAWRASLLPVTAGAVPAGLLLTAVIFVATRPSSGFVPVFAGTALSAWCLGFFLFSRQQEKHFRNISEQSFSYDGDTLSAENFVPLPGNGSGGSNPGSDIDRLSESTQPAVPDSVRTVGQLGSRLGRGELDPSDLPHTGFIPEVQRLKVNRVSGSALLFHGFNAVRDVFLSGEFAADGTPVWDLRTRLIKDIEDSAWKIGSVTDPGWHTRPR